MDFNLIPEEIRSEFQINENGQAFASRRAVARLAGVSDVAIGKLLEKVLTNEAPELFQPFYGQSFEGANLPDILAALIFEYYGYECQERYRSEQAKKVCRAFNAIGIRSWIQQQLGWQQSAQLSQSQPQTIAQMFYSVAQGLVEAENQREQLKTEQSRQRLELQEAKESISFLISARQEALNQLNEVERSPLTANPKSTRAKLVELVRRYSATNNIGFGTAFKKIYIEFKYRYGIDILARAKNQNKSGLIIAEQIPVSETGGVEAVEVLFAIASEVLV